MSVCVDSVQENMFQLKASFLPCMVLQLIHYHMEAIEQQLLDTLQKAPNLFIGSSIIVDLEKIKTTATIDFGKLKQLLESHSMMCLGVKNANIEQQEIAKKEGLSILQGKTHITDKELQKSTVANQTSTRFAKCITSPVRSGVQIYAKETDLIVTAPVSPGAELFADGNIHVYGPMRGRAMAGIQGNQDTRIFCQVLEAELVSIAGYYLTKEDLQVYAKPKLEKMMHIYLNNTQIQIEPI